MGHVISPHSPSLDLNEPWLWDFAPTEEWEGMKTLLNVSQQWVEQMEARFLRNQKTSGAENMTLT